ncbi:MAG: class I SAM-dependent methyltransferase [Micromonosporaceae bacterium]
MAKNLARYDPYADWYEEYVRTDATGNTERTERLLARLLGKGTGSCLDVCCGTGTYAAAIADLGWRPVGVDLSTGQLRHAEGRLPVACAAAEALPFADGRVGAVVCVRCHTDVPDYAAVVSEAARVLRPGGRFVHVGLHPCFCGAFADRSDLSRIVLGPGYRDTDLSFEAWSPHGVRARVGAWHLPLAGLVRAIVDAGLVLTDIIEDGPETPDLLGLAATKPATF